MLGLTMNAAIRSPVPRKLTTPSRPKFVGNYSVTLMAGRDAAGAEIRRRIAISGGAAHIRGAFLLFNSKQTGFLRLIYIPHVRLCGRLPDFISGLAPHEVWSPPQGFANEVEVCQPDGEPLLVNE